MTSAVRPSTVTRQPRPGYSYQQQPAGPTGAGGQQLAEWWKRLVAWIIDYFIIAVPTWILGFILGAFRTTLEFNQTTGSFKSTGGVTSGGGLLFTLLATVVPFVYHSVLDGGPNGQTIGKKLINIRWDSRRQAWHDNVGNSVVVDA